MARLANDFDSPWKEALDLYLPDFLALAVPRLHRDIDWSCPVCFLDKELQALHANAQAGRLYVDKLVRLRRRDGHCTWLLVHIEVQGGAMGPAGCAALSRRMFQYHCRIRERYLPAREGQASLYSLAILLASGQGPSTLQYRWQCLDCLVKFRYRVVHLGAWHRRWARLEALARHNPFAVIIMAQLQALRHGPGPQRLVPKTRLARLLAGYGYPEQTTGQLLRLIDWMLALPEALDAQFHRALQDIDKEHAMAYMTGLERLWLSRGREQGIEQGVQKGIEQGLQQGIEQGAATILQALIQSRFAGCPPWVHQRIAQANAEQLRQWAVKVPDARSIEAVFD